jgi:hypothetical protein
MIHFVLAIGSLMRFTSARLPLYYPQAVLQQERRTSFQLLNIWQNNNFNCKVDARCYNLSEESL